MLKKFGAPTKIDAVGHIKPNTPIQKNAGSEESRKAVIQNIDFQPTKKEKETHARP
jgi:hypothetical protein